ncbi:hypothetical protein EVAR_103819_1 [Eumeta japonica]|uniref:Uncharacterized protein n=1 Tax=Eumeta variegata TaxID=151549 RepID=A0A4C2AAD2_EUMVA|nr:hypothetical protein EVAR_103819_1 [Eumeta japonica]
MNYETLLVVVILAVQEAISEVQIRDVKDQKLVLTKTDDVFLFEETTFLFHITNLSKILTPYELIFKEKRDEFTTEELIWLRKIETLADQLNEHGISEKFKKIEKQEKWRSIEYSSVQ